MNKNITVSTNIPGLKDKIQTNITNPEDIFWYIKFNLDLDEKSVSEKTMGVTDTDGYIMRVDISYNEAKRLIVICPLDTYEQGVFYMLRISRKVRSKSGKHLKTQIYILFKINNNQISEFKTLKGNVPVPPERRRPSNYDEMFRAKLRAAQMQTLDDPRFREPGHLPLADMPINIIPGVLGIFIALFFFVTKSVVVLAAGAVVALFGLAVIFAQLSKRETRGILAYNSGARRFNSGRYQEAKEYLDRALEIDPESEKVRMAMEKIKFYL
ncbi:MAG: tetratricopeptide repeat protein [Clostridiales bacterium]|jgi:hypothetical protein|nr:tetratricopeptide repeat protein [Clostridiales bacterium]